MLSVGGLVFDEQEEMHCPLGGSRKTMARWFGILAHGTKAKLDDTRPRGSMNWSIVLKGLVNRCRPGALIFLISDFFDFDGELRHLLFRLKRSANLMAFSVFDPMEEHLPSLGRVGMAFGEERVVFDSSDRRLQKKYEKRWQEQQVQVAEAFRSMGIEHLRFSTADSPDTQLRRLFLR